jgi:hypothetical protein
MTTATRKPKQTAGNSPFLAECRRAFNDPTYRRCLELVNAEGEQAAREWLLKDVTRKLDF